MMICMHMSYCKEVRHAATSQTGDAPGTLHHVIIRGIEGKEIVKDDYDRQNFVRRMRDDRFGNRNVNLCLVIM